MDGSVWRYCGNNSKHDSFLVLICCYHPASNMPDSMYYPSHLQGMIWEKYIGVWGGILILLLKLILVFLFGVFCSEAALLISVICANRYVVFVGILTFYLVNWILTPGKYSVFVEQFLLRGDFLIQFRSGVRILFRLYT